MLWRRSAEDDRARWPPLASYAYAFLCRHAGLIWFAGAVVIGVAICAYNGIDASYDRLNYHIASARSLLQGRVFDDVAISGIQTYFNPVITLELDQPSGCRRGWLSNLLLVIIDGPSTLVATDAIMPWGGRERYYSEPQPYEFRGEIAACGYHASREWPALVGVDGHLLCR